MNYSCFKLSYPTSWPKGFEINLLPEKITKYTHVSFYTVVFYAEEWGRM